MEASGLLLESYEIKRQETAVALFYLIADRHFSATDYELLRYNGTGDIDYLNFMTGFGA
jgi:hypothetical protein